MQSEFLPFATPLLTTNLGAAAYANPTGANSHGNQAIFDIPTDGEDDEGLRITIGRALLVGDAGNAVEVDISVDVSLNAPTAAYAAGVLTIVYDAAPRTFDDLKTVIDALANISSDYYGNAGAASEATDFAGGRFNAGTPDPEAIVRVGTVHDIRIVVAAAQPAVGSSAARIVPEKTAATFRIPPGMQVWFRSNAGANRVFSVEIWKTGLEAFAKI